MLPLATDNRFDADTLFIIFEEDFRFTPVIGDPAWTHEHRKDTSNVAMSRICGRTPTAEAASSTSSAAAAPSSHNKIPKTTAVEPTAHPKVADKYVIRPRASGEAWKHTSMFLRDLVGYATLAHRQGRGDFMFMGWQPHGSGDSAGAKQVRFRSGTMLTMVSQEGFLRLARDWDINDALKHPGHVDLCLKKYWSQPENNRVSYISPPIGGYTSHLSGTSKEFFAKERPTIWMEAFACPGTRRCHDWEDAPRGREKWFCTFTTQGKCHFMGAANVDVPDHSVIWHTWDERTATTEAEPTAGGSNWHWDAANQKRDWKAISVRQQRAGRVLRLRGKFRFYAECVEQACVNSYCTVCIERTIAFA